MCLSTLDFQVCKETYQRVVSRTTIKDYTIDTQASPLQILTKKKQSIRLDKVQSANATDYILLVTSPGKEQKELSMQSAFDKIFLIEIEKIKTSLIKKQGVKK